MTTEPPGIIDANKAYTIKAFCDQLGTKPNSTHWRSLNRAGLTIRLKRYVLGSDFIRLLESDGNLDQKDPRGQNDRS